MPKRHGAREQKKAAKQKAKRDTRRRQLARQSSPDPNVRLKTADRWPVVACLVPENLWTGGLGQLVFARRTPDGHVACAIFLLDVFCLGVKNAFWRIASSHEFDDLVERIEESGGPLQKVSPEYFSKLVHCAADYGQSLGFAPHRDFRHARLLLSGIDPSLCHEEFQFGQDGKPFYIRGPNESLARAHAIAEQVHAQGGEYVVPLKADEEGPYAQMSDPAGDYEDDEDDFDDAPDEDDGDENIIDV